LACDLPTFPLENSCRLSDEGNDVAGVRPVADYAIGAADRAAAMARAHLEGGWSLAEVARAFGVHYSTVSRAARRARAEMRQCKT